MFVDNHGNWMLFNVLFAEVSGSILWSNLSLLFRVQPFLATFTLHGTI